MEINQLPETIQKSIEVVAANLKVPVEQLLTYAVRGVHVEGMIQLVLGLIFAIGLAVTYCKIFLYLKKEDDYEWEMGAVLIAIPFVLGFIISTIATYISAIKTFAPEYWILKSILNF